MCISMFRVRVYIVPAALGFGCPVHISTKSIGVPHISTKNVGVLGSLGIAPWSISTGDPSGSRVVDLSSGWE